jgi:hypothetical protein
MRFAVVPPHWVLDSSTNPQVALFIFKPFAKQPLRKSMKIRHMKRGKAYNIATQR